MADFNVYLDNFLAPPPDNWEEIDIELSFENDAPEASIRTATFTWSGESAKIINEARAAGLIGGAGIYEGVALRLEVCEPNLVAFDGCVDATTTETTFTCDIVKASAQETNRIDSLDYKAESFNFAFLKRLPVNSAGKILTTDYVKIPYVISRIPDYEQVLILGVSFVEMVRILRDTVKTTEILINDLTGELANVPPTPVAVAMKILSILLYVVYIIFLIIMLIRLLKLIVANIIQSIKYKFGMRIDTLMTRASQYLQLNGFVSTILQSGTYRNAVIIPRKSSSLNAVTFNDVFFGNTSSRKTYDDALNLNSAVPSYGYYDGTFWQLIQDCKMLFNAKVSIRNNTLYFERWDHYVLPSGVTLPPISSEAPFEDPYGTNASELASNYFVKYQLDGSDFNTYDQFEGTSCQAIFRPVIVNNPNNILLKNLKYVSLPFALGKRKTQLTYPEKLINIIGNAINVLMVPLNLIISTVNNVVGGNVVPPAVVPPIFGTRIGALLLENDFTGIQKFVIVNDPDVRGVSFLSASNQANTSALAMQNNFHSASWMYDASGNAPNQYLTYKNKEIPLCCSDFAAIRDNNFVTTYDQKPARIVSCRWNPHTETAAIDYRAKEKFTNNLVLKLIVDGES